jgi:tRNA modification GTPase
MKPIFALSTSFYRSALHVHRLSGQGLFTLLAPYLVSPHTGKALSLEPLAQSPQKPYTRYALMKGLQGETLDDVMVTFYKGPYSYTGEDLIEVSSHGNPIISQRLAHFFRHLGIEDAKPGDFTYRSFLNGKRDMIEAESIHELICAENQASLDLIRTQAFEGFLSKEIEDLRLSIVDVLSYLEAHIDFAPDEVGDYEPLILKGQVEKVMTRLDHLLASYSYGQKVKEGISVVLFGEPNAGKSSLYNALLKQERAIVTSIPGTTRDVLKENLFIDSRDFTLIDTAGIRETEDVIEKMGVSKSLEEFHKADIKCLLLDASSVKSLDLSMIFEKIKKLLEPFTLQGKSLIIVLTKKDLLTQKESEDLQEGFIKEVSNLWSTTLYRVVMTSHEKGQGCEELISALKDLHDEMMQSLSQSKGSAVLISQRQKDKVLLAKKALEEALELISNLDFPEKIASQINHAKHLLEEITGEILLDSVYDRLFSSFCIGK